MKRQTATSPDAVERYALRVTNSEVVAGPLVRLACKRHLDDLERGPSRGLDWDREAAERAIGFFRDVLCLNGGEHEGKPFILHESQEFIVGSLFGWKAPDGFRRFRVAFVEIGKGNGKSPLAAGIGLYMMMADKEPRAEIYAAAVDKDQAQILFRDAIAMVNQSPHLASRLVKSGGEGREWNLADLKTGSFFRPISSEHRGRGKSGPRPHCSLLDEVHEHPTNAMVEFMRAGTKGRRQALMFMITNSGFDRKTVCWDYHKQADRVLKEVLENDSFFGFVCSLDEGDDWRDEAVWPKANPLIDVSITRKYLQEQVAEAKGMPSKQSIVRRLNFCEWTEGESAWLAQEVWDAAQAHLDFADYAGRKCHGGVDLSFKRDLTALSLVFDHDDGGKAAFVWFFMPGEGVREREDRDGVPYGLWRDQGYIEATPGPVVDYSFVAVKIATLAEDVEIESLACDTYKRDHLQVELDEIGCPVPLVNHPQGFRKQADSSLWMPMSVEVTEEAIVKGQLRVRSNPCLTWNAASVVMEPDAQGNRKPEKKKSTGRIDGIVALIEAMGAASARTEQQPSYSMFFV
jgi:phage terminase large subunit-like protein